MIDEEQWIYNKLDKMNIAYERHDHEPIYSVIEAAKKGIVLPGQQVKNLVLKNKKGRQFYLVILRDEKIADIKKLATELEEKRLSFANSEELAHLLHVEPGAVTPFGLFFDIENKIQVIVDDEVNPNLTVGFHPFNHGTTLNISYTDFEYFVKESGHSLLRINC